MGRCAAPLAAVLVALGMFAAQGEPSEYEIIKALRRFGHADDLGWGSKTNYHPCGWAGIACDVTGNIVQLKLNGLGLYGGQLPKEWSLFEHLKAVDLRDNGLTGTLPKEWGQMKSLEYLYLEDNSLEGPIPETWCNIKTFKHLYLDNNDLDGTVPDCGEWREMEDMRLENNGFSGGFPKGWGTMSKLRILIAGSNRFSGPLPLEWSNMQRVEHVHLDNNKASGPLPLQWSFLAFLKSLYLHGNALDGKLPGEYGWLMNLNILSLDGNKFSGPLPESWWQLSNLEYLYLQDNELEGPLPGSWGALAKLKEIHLDNNKLQGQLPRDWGALRSLTHMYLRKNRLVGDIPGPWASLVNIQEVYLWGNELSGPLPAGWGRLSSLRVIDLHENRLTGLLPPAWGTLSRLEYLYLHDNELGSTLPGEWGDMAELRQLMLQGNNLQDTSLPVGWQKMKKLQALNLADNDISAVIRKDWIPMIANLRWLGLENNALACIEGSILEGFSQTARNTFLAQLRRMTAQEPGHSSDIDACIEAAPPAPLSPPPPPAPPAMPTSPPPYTAPPHPSSPPQPAEPPPAVPPSPPPPPPPPTSRTPTSLPAEAMKPPAATTPSGYPPAKTAAPKVVVADPPRLGSIASAALESPSGPVREGNTAKLSLDDGGGGGNDAVRPSEIQDEDSQSTGTTTPAPVEVRGMVADVNDVITRALVVAAALVFAFVIVLVIGGAVWYLHATRPEDADGISAAAHGSNNNNVTMQPSPLGILPETPRTDDGFSAQGGSARHIDDTPPRSPVARVVRSALFRHGLPTPRAAEGAAAPDAGPPPADGSLASSQMGGGSNLEPMVLATRASRVSWAGYSRRVLTGQLHGTDHPLSARGASTDRSEKLGYQDSPNMPVPKAQTARFHRSNSCNYDGILQVATAPNFQSGEVPGPCAPAQTSHLPVPPRAVSCDDVSTCPIVDFRPQSVGAQANGGSVNLIYTMPLASTVPMSSGALHKEPPIRLGRMFIPENLA